MSSAHVHVWIEARVIFDWIDGRCHIINYKRCACGKVLH